MTPEQVQAIERERYELHSATGGKPIFMNLPTPEEYEVTIEQEAETLYRFGRLPEYVMSAFRKIWYGDEHVLQAMLLQVAALHVINSKSGINLHIAGSTGTGKSDSVRAAAKFMPFTKYCESTFSNQALFHSKKFHEKMVIFSDDTQFNPETAQLLRGILTNWETGSSRETMVGKEWVTVNTPPRLNIILTSVDNVSKLSEDAQDESRFMTLDLVRNSESLRMIKKMMQSKLPDISREIEVIKRALSQLPMEVVNLHKEIEDDTMPLREFGRYLVMVRASAMLHGRTETNDSDIAYVDYLVSRSRRMMETDIAGLTPREKLVYSCLKNSNKKMTSGQIQSAIKKTSNYIFVAIRGEEGTLSNPCGGLLMRAKDFRMQYDNDIKDTIYWVEQK